MLVSTVQQSDSAVHIYILFKNISLAALDLSCNTWDLCCIMWDLLLLCVDSLVVARGLSSCGTWA